MIELSVNGRTRRIDADASTPLLYVLRDDLGLVAAKFGCGLGQCGACTVLVDDQPVFSCITPIAVLPGRAITTVEGLGTPDKPGIVQRAFEMEQAAQCGYCIPGMIARAEALLRQSTTPSEDEMRTAMSPSLCRCGTHMRIAGQRPCAAAVSSIRRSGWHDRADPA
jgi:nicotinate dehydrogenase subunit A